MMSQTPRNIDTARGFNLIEVMLSLVFFALAFSAMMVGTQSIIQANLTASDLHAENSAIASVLNDVDYRSLGVEAQWDVGLTRRGLNITETNTTGASTTAKKLFYQLNVYSQPQSADIKIADLIVYKSLTGGQPYRRIQRKVSLLNECHNYGATQNVSYGDLICAPVPVANNLGAYTAIADIMNVNRSSARETAYTLTGGAFNTQQTNLSLFNPETDNVWGGIVPPAGAMFTDAGPLGTQRLFSYAPNLLTSTTLGTNESRVLNTGMMFNSASTTGPQNINVTLLMPASSDLSTPTRLNSTETVGAAFRYNLEIGVFVATAGEKVRVYPNAANAPELTGGLGYIDVQATSNNQHMTIRLDNVQPLHHPESDRPFVGASLLMVAANGTTLNPSNVNVTHMIKRPHFES